VVSHDLGETSSRAHTFLVGLVLRLSLSNMHSFHGIRSYTDQQPFKTYSTLEGATYRPSPPQPFLPPLLHPPRAGQAQEPGELVLELPQEPGELELELPQEPGELELELPQEPGELVLEQGEPVLELPQELEQGELVLEPGLLPNGLSFGAVRHCEWVLGRLRRARLKAG